MQFSTWNGTFSKKQIQIWNYSCELFNLGEQNLQIGWQ